MKSVPSAIAVVVAALHDDDLTVFDFIHEPMHADSVVHLGSLVDGNGNIVEQGAEPGRWAVKHCTIINDGL